MLITDIYQQFQIMPSLQLHQLRVAAVARIVSQAAAIEESELESITQACLLHDMGNIIKFDLQAMAFPQFLEPEGPIFWREVQKNYVDRYGSDEHEATMTIAQEIGATQQTLELIDAIGFHQLAKNFEEKNLAKMICEYGDNRVSPLGIVSLETRLKDLADRYSRKYHSPQDETNRRYYQDMARKSEDYIFSQVKIAPSDITDQALDDTITELKGFVF